MKTQLKVTLVFLIALYSIGSVSFANAANNNNDNLICDMDKGGQSQMNICAAKIFTSYDDELNRLYKEQMATLEPRVGKDRFKNAQLSWLKYRDASCLYSTGPKEESGTIWPLIHFNCMSKFTKERIVWLKSYLNCTENGCPR